MRSLLFVLALFGGAAFAQTPLDKTMVVINGQAIDAKTYFKRMEVMPNVGQLVNDKFVPATPGFLTLSKLVNETLMLQLAKEKGVFPTDAEVDAQIKEIQADNPEILSALQRIGFTLDDLKYDTKIKLAEFKLQTMGVNITDQQVETFYKENPKGFTMPKRYKLRVIAVDTDEKKRSVESALNSGKAFGDVAKDLSLDVSRAEGGDMGEIAEGTLAPATLAAVKSTRKGSTTDWLSNDGLSVKFLVEDVLESKLLPLDADLRKNIRRNLMLDRGRVVNNIGTMMVNARKKARIEYQGTPFDDQLKEIFGKG